MNYLHERTYLVRWHLLASFLPRRCANSAVCLGSSHVYGARGRRSHRRDAHLLGKLGQDGHALRHRRLRQDAQELLEALEAGEVLLNASLLRRYAQKELARMTN